MASTKSSTPTKLSSQAFADLDIMRLKGRFKMSSSTPPSSGRANRWSPGSKARPRSRRRSSRGQTPHVVVGPNAIKHLPAELSRLFLSSPLIVSSPSRISLARQIQALLPHLDSQIISSDATSVPIRVSSCDSVVSVGGDSAIAWAKSISLSKAIPHICVPTTYCGSERSRSLVLSPRGDDRSASECGREPTSSKAVSDLANRSKSPPNVIIYDESLTMGPESRISVPADEDTNDVSVCGRESSTTDSSCWSFLHIPVI